MPAAPLPSVSWAAVPLTPAALKPAVVPTPRVASSAAHTVQTTTAEPVPVLTASLAPAAPQSAVTAVSAPTIPAILPGALALPSSIPPPQGTVSTVSATKEQKIIPAARVFAQSASLPAARVIDSAKAAIAPRSPSVAVPKFQPAQAAFPPPAPASARPQQRPAVVIDYSVLAALMTQSVVVPTPMRPTYVQNSGPVTVDYSVLQ
jgi:hypothetical protein